MDIPFHAAISLLGMFLIEMHAYVHQKNADSSIVCNGAAGVEVGWRVETERENNKYPPSTE